MSGNIHVVPGGDGWNVGVEGRAGASHFRTQREAIVRTSELQGLRDLFGLVGD